MSLNSAFEMERNTAQGSSHALDTSTEATNLSKRWTELKPIILNLYITQDMHLSTVVNIMKKDHSFHAVGRSRELSDENEEYSENSYKYYFNQWGISKNISAEVKEEAIKALGKRIRDATSTPDIYMKDQPINKKRLRRHISTIEKKLDAIELGSNVFMYWNLPFRAFRTSSSIGDHFSPFSDTPAYLHIHNTNESQSPRSLPSPNNAPTPTVLAIRSRQLNERARDFIQAKHEDLLKRLEKSEKEILTTYLYQFWFFAFKTAKYWGHGPINWNADLLEFDRFSDKTTRSLLDTPRNVGTPGSANTPRSDRSFPLAMTSSGVPSSLCRWTIHAGFRIRFEGEQELRAFPEEDIDGPEEDERWHRWPDAESKLLFEDKLQAALETNNFSNISAKSLPIAVTQVTKAVRRSRKELLQEGFGFSLVARNEEVFWQILPRAAAVNFKGSGIFPFHLLTSFLDGSKTCCNLLDGALNGIAEYSSIDDLYIDNHGHTVLDNLMITILKGHTSCRPAVVDDKWAKLKRFTGEEVDICGRWDADSSCIRNLFAEGHANIPFEWKHMFCHTSVQAICHSIGRLFGPCFAPPIDLPSGLFVKHCQACGEKLQLLPLHSLVLTAVHVARSGCPGENMFGMLACLVCLLANGADPGEEAHISIDALMNRDNALACSHEDMDASQLAEKVPDALITDCAEDVVLGWQVFCSVLRYARDERRPESKGNRRHRETEAFDTIFGFNDTAIESIERDDTAASESDSDQSLDYDSDADEELCQHSKSVTGNFYGASKTIGTLWAAIQTEFVTYRRLQEGDPWISQYFDMRSLLNGLENGGIISIPLVEDDMMNSFCKCGRFLDTDDEACACVDEVCAYHFANIDSEWKRANYVQVPEGRNESWYDLSYI